MRWSTIGGSQRTHSHTIGAIVFVLACSSCGRWPEGTWVPTTPGFGGELKIRNVIDVGPVFHMRLTGPDGPVDWEGGAHHEEGGIWLNVYQENGASIYGKKSLHVFAHRAGRALKLTAGTREVEFRRR